MSQCLLDRIRRMKQYIQDNDASYDPDSLCAEIGNDAGASVLLVDTEGAVRGAFGSTWGNSNRIPAPISARLASVEDMCEVQGTFLMSDGGSGWSLIIPVTVDGRRLGSVVLHRQAAFSDDDRVVAEYAALLAAFRLSSIVRKEEIEKKRMKKRAAEAADSLALDEYVAMSYLFRQMQADEDTVVIGHIAEGVGATRNQIMKALRRLEEAEVIECRSSGMRGTHVNIRNPFLRDVFSLSVPS